MSNQEWFDDIKNLDQLRDYLLPELINDKRLGAKKERSDALRRALGHLFDNNLIALSKEKNRARITKSGTDALSMFDIRSGDFNNSAQAAA